MERLAKSSHSWGFGLSQTHELGGLFFYGFSPPDQLLLTSIKNILFPIRTIKRDLTKYFFKSLVFKIEGNLKTRLAFINIYVCPL